MIYNRKEQTFFVKFPNAVGFRGFVLKSARCFYF